MASPYFGPYAAYTEGMPESEERRRKTMRYRTIRFGKGKTKRYLHVAIVRTAGPRGGHTVAGPAHAYRR